MGYRSDVGIALSKEAAAILKTKLETAKTDERYLFDHADRHEIDDDSGDELWRWNYVKWYDEHPDVSFATRFLHELEPDKYLYARAGEEYDDLELNGGYWQNAFGLGISTAVVPL